MKATILLLTAIVGLTSAQVLNLDKLDITNLAGAKSLYNAAGAAGGDLILNKLGSLFLAAYKNDEALKGMSVADIIANFIANTKQIFSLTDESSWSRGLDNPLLGWTKQTFQSLLTLQTSGDGEEGANGTIGSSNPSRSKRQAAAALPASVDWRTKGAVTPVKNQGQCGSCWAFATIGAIEGRIGVKTGSAPILSEQNLMDCAKNGSDGCNGGKITDGYQYVQNNGGVDSSASYPYETKNGECRYDPAGNSGDVTGFQTVISGDEDDLKRAVAAGPVAVAVDATEWQYYKSGIFKTYTFKVFNHGVVIVGYGTESTMFGLIKTDYWIVKNSWGANWGEKGYIRVARNSGNTIGIASRANYPLV